MVSVSKSLKYLFQKSWLTQRANFTTRNKQLHLLNTAIASVLSGNIREFFSANTVFNAEEGELHYQRAAQRFTRSCLATRSPTLVKSWVHSHVASKSSTTNGHVNKTINIVERITNNIHFLLFATGNNKGNICILLRVLCDPGDNDFPIAGFTRTQ